MTLTDLDLSDLRFRTSDAVEPALERACASNPDIASCETIGHSEAGRPILGFTLGSGPAVVTLVAGAHADEPVGAETLRTLILEGLAARGWGAEDGGLADLLTRVTFRIVPHVNPDGEARNRAWVEAWDTADVPATLAAFLRGRRREPPGRDVEFGYPAMRPENRAAQAFLFDGAPVVLHASLHGMAFSEGALVLVERRWIGTPPADSLVADWLASAAAAGLRPHDHDRHGDKGFVYGGPGVWSTPEGRAMRAHFLAVGDDATAAGFYLSSMEAAVESGTDADSGCTPLCLVPEVPRFVVGAGQEPTAGVASHLAAFLDDLPAMQTASEAGEPLDAFVAQHGVRCVPLEDAVRLQLLLLDLGLRAVGV